MKISSRLTAAFTTFAAAVICVLCLAVPADAKAAKNKEGITLAGVFVPSDTETLCISSRDKITLKFVADYIPEGCLIAAPDDSYYQPVFDIAEMAEKLPKLKRLYIHQAVLKNEKRITKMTNLETLSYWHSKYNSGGYIETLNDAPFAGMKNLKELRIYGGLESYKFLSKMTSLEKVYIEYGGGDGKKLSQIYSCPCVTELSISDVKDISGIEKLKKLRRLELKTSSAIDLEPLGKLKKLRELDAEVRNSDLTPLGELKNLRKLSLETDGTAKGISSLTKLKKLKTLTLNGMTRLYEDEWAFLSDMKTVEDLSILYSNSKFSGALAEMIWLKELTLMDISGGRLPEFLPKLSGLESFFFMGDFVDISGISKLKNLKYVSIWLSEFSDLSELKKCHELETLNIYNNNSDFDCKWLSGSSLKKLFISAGGSGKAINIDKLSSLTELKTLTLDFTGISAAAAKKLKKALPECGIEVYELSGTTEY